MIRAAAAIDLVAAEAVDGEEEVIGNSAVEGVIIERHAILPKIHTNDRDHDTPRTLGGALRLGRTRGQAEPHLVLNRRLIHLGRLILAATYVNHRAWMGYLVAIY